MHDQSRRKFIKQASLASGLALGMPSSGLSFLPKEYPELKVHIFSKHLQFLDYQEMASMAKSMGFDGVDLTVRPKGHVLPENVERDLPLAAKAIRDSGLDGSLFTTAVESAENPLDRTVLETAAKNGFSTYRMNWYRYHQDIGMPEELERYQNQIKDLSELNGKLGLVGCYQNHAGNLVGASLWEVYEILKQADPKYFGVQYDIRHATVEGGVSWPNGLRLVQSLIKTLVLKDVKWTQVEGKWKLVNTPIGEGMVDFKPYFKLLKQYKIDVPVTLHLEYPLGGAERGANELTCDPQVVYDAMKRDLKAVRQYWKEA